MKILIVAGYFPPYAPASASRVNKLAKYLDNKGHDIRVLAPTVTSYSMVLTPEISQDKVIFTDFTDINEWPGRVKAFVKSLLPSKKASSQNVTSGIESVKPVSSGKESSFSTLFRKISNIPDNVIGWYPHAVRAGRELFTNWTPDIIFCTVPPHSGLLVASRLAKMVNVPWVADYRDLWTGHGYYQASWSREKIDHFLESRALSNCKGLIAVTKSWTEHLKVIHDLPVECVMNGFDPDDFTGNVPPYDTDKVTIIYAGLLYGRKRDPSALFEAMGRMGGEVNKIRLLMFTPDAKANLDDEQLGLVKKYGLEKNIEFSRYIPQKELLKIQAGVDILMLLRWDNPREDGVIAGKLFEYIGAGKTILSIGSTTGEAADIIRDNDFGVVSNDPDEIARFLKEKIAQKASGKPQALNPKRDNFNRAYQFAKLEKFLQKVAKREA